MADPQHGWSFAEHYDKLLSVLVIVVTALRWWHDRQLMKELDITEVRRRQDIIRADLDRLRADFDQHMEKFPNWIRNAKNDVKEYINREILHLKELIGRRR